MWFRYRKNGGQVIAASMKKANPWPEDKLLGVCQVNRTNDDTRLLWCDGQKVRSATPEEIAAFPIAAAQDAEQTYAKDMIDEHLAPEAFARIMRAMAKLTLQEINLLRQQVNLESRTMEQIKNAIRDIIDEE